MPLPTIVHLDADAFFVSVEQVRRPELRGRKVAVGGRERGIISSASYEARACGVYTPMPTVRALRICPDLILVPHTPGLYGRYSGRMFELCESVTPLVQRNSIDEGYLDLAPCGLGSLGEIEAVLRRLQQRMRDELGLSVSLGVAANKLVAQIASKLRKPAGFVVVPPGTEAEFLAPLPVGKLPGVGAKTEAVLEKRHGIKLVHDLRELPEARLPGMLGSGWRGMLAAARGEDESPVATEAGEAKSYSQQETFGADVAESAVAGQVVKRMLDELMPKVRADGKRVRTLTVKVRYPDFSEESRGRSLAAASDLEGSFYALGETLLHAAWRQRRPLRLVSVRLSGVEESPRQLDLFAEGEERRRRLAGVLDRLNRDATAAAVLHGHQLETGGRRRARSPGLPPRNGP